MNLTDTQRSILGLIAEGIARDGMPPSQAELARAMGFAGVRAVQYHLEGLEQAGAIRRLPGKARGLKLLLPPEALHGEGDLFAQADDATAASALPGAPAANDDALRLPVLGRVAAGLPIGAAVDPLADDFVLLDRVFFSPAPDYLLRVKGDSMRDEGIFEGDLIGVHRTSDARSGQIVVARIEDEVTVKLLKIGRDRIRLLPRNPDYEPIEVRPDQDFAIEGLYCGLVRPNR
jgi:repressor LexA